MRRIVFLDWLRVLACLMVLVVHACEQFYFDADGNFFIASRADALAVVGIDSAMRACVPLFVMASAYLLFPLSRPAGEFFSRRVLRVLVPFAVWCCIYNWWNGGSWSAMLFNFPMATGGHLWFVPMLCGLYLLMPLLSPWAEKASKKEVQAWILVWLFTTLFPYLRKICFSLCGEPIFGAVPFLYGECPWNGFGAFQYVSGFFGYMLLGFYARKFLPELSWRKTFAFAAPLIVLGWTVVFSLFYFRISKYGIAFPVKAPYSAAVDLEMSWEFCSLGVAATVMGYFLLIRKLSGEGFIFRWLVQPISKASYGMYLAHILILVPVVAFLRPLLPTVLTICLGAIVAFAIAAAIMVACQKIPKIGKYIAG